MTNVFKKLDKESGKIRPGIILEEPVWQKVQLMKVYKEIKSVSKYIEDLIKVDLEKREKKKEKLVNNAINERENVVDTGDL